MKRVIDGKIYNTDTAERIGTHGYSNFRDFRYENTDLYKTKKGAWFLCGEGGPLSRWSQSRGNEQTGGSGIEALTTTEALAWCEAAGINADTIAEYFLVVEA